MDGDQKIFTLSSHAQAYLGLSLYIRLQLLCVSGIVTSLTIYYLRGSHIYVGGCFKNHTFVSRYKNAASFYAARSVYTKRFYF